MKTVERRVDHDVIEPLIAWTRKQQLERFILVAQRRVYLGGSDCARRPSAGQVLEHPPGLIVSAQKSVGSGDPPTAAWIVGTPLKCCQRLRVQAHRVVDIPTKTVYGLHSRFQFQRPVQAPQRIVEPPGAIQNSCEVHLNRWSQRIELFGAFHVGDGFRETSELAQEQRVGVVRMDIVGIECQGALH